MKGMNAKLLGLAVLAVLTVALFALQMRNKAPDEPALLLGGLAASLGEVQRVALSAPGTDTTTGATTDTTTVSRQDGAWVVEEKSGYPADFEKLHGLLTNLAEARLAEPKTARPENHGQLGLASAGTADETGTLVRVELASGERFEVMVGKASQHRDGTFVRLAGEDQAWLIDKSLSASPDSGEWIDGVAINVDAASIVKVEMISETGEVLVGEREEDKGITVKNIPGGTTLKYGTVGDTLGRALVNLRIEDVEPLDADAWAAHNRATFNRDNGDVIVADTMMADERRLLRLSLDLSDESDLAAMKSRESWQFEISSYAYDSLTKTMDDMVNRESPDEPAEEGGSSQ